MMISKESDHKGIALLIDPDSQDINDISELIDICVECRVDTILVGGSLTYVKPGELIRRIKSACSVPVFIFPGNLLQLDESADGILLLSLISGRNPELLIGNHVVAAPLLKQMSIDIIPVGYILINCGSMTSVEYMSQTEAIPHNKPSITVATAIAGEMLGLKMIYLEAGSGALHHVPTETISSVKSNISVPLVVGGGIRSAKSVDDIFRAGADTIVLGNGAASNPGFLREACRVRDLVNA